MNSASPFPFWFKLLSWTGVIIWAGTIFYFSSLSGAEIQEIGFTFWDKGMHFIAFTAGGAALVCALRFSTMWTWKKILLFSIIALAAYGAFDEIHQLRTPNRYGADFWDWLADALGGIAGSLITAGIYVAYQRSNQGASPAN